LTAAVSILPVIGDLSGVWGCLPGALLRSSGVITGELHLAATYAPNRGVGHTVVHARYWAADDSRPAQRIPRAATTDDLPCCPRYPVKATPCGTPFHGHEGDWSTCVRS
jgi:hypothetical protein